MANTIKVFEYELRGEPSEELENFKEICSKKKDFIPVVELDRDIKFPKRKAEIKVCIFANGDVVAKLKDTDICAEGHTIEEAIEALKLEVDEEYHFFQEIKKQIPDRLKKQFDVIKKFF